MDSIEDKDIFDLTAWLPYQLWVISNVAAVEVEAFYKKKHNLKRLHWQIMASLARFGSQTPKDLAHMAMVDRVAVSRGISQMQDLGLIKREFDINDKRKNIIKLTKKGEKIFSSIVPVLKESERKTLNLMPGDDVNDFRRAVDVIYNKIR